jgi:hypothetical protein
MKVVGVVDLWLQIFLTTSLDGGDWSSLRSIYFNGRVSLVYLFIHSVTHVTLDMSITDYSLYITTQFIIYIDIFIIISGSAAQRGLWPSRSRGYLITQRRATVGRTPLDE